MRRDLFLLLAVLLAAGAAGPLAAAFSPAPGPGEATPDPAGFFEKKIRPLLANRCQKCHGRDRQQGGLRLDSRAAILKGGGRGPAVEPGQPEQSVLIAAVRHLDWAPVMPPGQQLPNGDINDLARWIRDGAPWPDPRAAARPTGSGAEPADSRAGDPPAPPPQQPPAAAGREVRATSTHWAFQPVRRPPLPTVRNRAWVRSPIDAFILAGLEAKGLKPALPADRRTLIRRATFDLTGLPPTPEEVEAFAADRSPDAFAKVVDRLLASPAYGERWGRHWLDVARYADSNGMDENVHYGNAWRFRDYVVASINRDKPFDRFITEQLAGDLLAAGDPPPPAAGTPGGADGSQSRDELLIASGFLSIGPKLISEVDDQKMMMDTLDEQLDTVGRTFMGLTLGCARCHDHKFDPISTQEYYALAGIFKSTRTMEIMKKPRMWHEHSLAGPADLARKAAYEQRVAAQKQAIEQLAAKAAADLKAGLKPGETLPRNPEPSFPPDVRAGLKALRDALAEMEKDPPVMPAAMGVTEGEVTEVPVHIRGDFLNLGPVMPRGVPAVIAGPPAPVFDRRRSGRLELARWLVDPVHPLTGRVFVNRVWRWHFGRGIVASTDNFGRLGERPANPALLDWLASSFVTGKQGDPGPGGGGDRASPPWSLKALHRLLMLSSTYRMSSAWDPRAAAVDPEDRLLWRWPIQRLDAEEIRDAVLAVSGQLDRTMGGTILPLKNREYIFDHTSKDMTRYESRRRSLYLPVVRNHLYDFYQIFDFGDGAIPEGNRPTTTVAPQALFMLNSSLVMDAAAALAKEVLAKPAPDDPARIRVLYERLYGRPATPGELARARALIARFEQQAENGARQPELNGPETPAPGAARERAWSWFCQTLMTANEFVYVT